MTDNQYSAEARDFVRQLFGSGEEPDVEPTTPTDISGGNVVPKEGATVPPPKADEMLDYVRQLFHGVNPHDHTSN